MSRRSRDTSANLPQHRTAQQISAVQHTQFSGPLPPPALLAEFERVLPGSAERILQLAEGHARDAWSNNRAVRFLTKFSTISATLIVMSVLAGSFYLITIGREVGGYAGIVTALGVPIAAFFRRKAPASEK